MEVGLNPTFTEMTSPGRLMLCLYFHNFSHMLYIFSTFFTYKLPEMLWYSTIHPRGPKGTRKRQRQRQVQAAKSLARSPGTQKRLQWSKNTSNANKAIVNHPRIYGWYKVHTIKIWADCHYCFTTMNYILRVALNQSLSLSEHRVRCTLYPPNPVAYQLINMVPVEMAKYTLYSITQQDHVSGCVQPMIEPGSSGSL